MYKWLLWIPSLLYEFAKKPKNLGHFIYQNWSYWACLVGNDKFLLQACMLKWLKLLKMCFVSKRISINAMRLNYLYLLRSIVGTFLRIRNESIAWQLVLNLKGWYFEIRNYHVSTLCLHLRSLEKGGGGRVLILGPLTWLKKFWLYECLFCERRNSS